MLDGDALRQGLCKNLGFWVEDRRENIRRAGEVAHMLVDSGVLTLAALITPFEEDRTALRNLFQEGRYLEMFCNSSLEVCEQRDTKGLYKKARSGDLDDRYWLPL
ncbi:MAG: adenylylsulfate kinase [Cellvibrionaceae bacterium]|jgi:adenylylsulfate kinase